MTDFTHTQDVHDDEIDLRELFGVFYSRKLSILAIAIFATLIGVAYALMSPPVYQADALLQLEEKTGGGLAMSPEMSALFGEEPQAIAEIEIIKSRMILGAAIENQNLHIIAEPKRLPAVGDFLRRYDITNPEWAFLGGYAWHDEKIDVSRLTVPLALDGEPLTLTALGGDHYSIALGDGLVLEGTVGQTLRDDISGFSLLVDRLIGEPGRMFTVQSTSFAEILQTVRGSLSISEKGKGSSILQLTMKGPNAQQAVEILDEITQVYLLQNLTRNSAEAEASLTFIRDQLPDAQAKVTLAEEVLNAFRESQSSVDLTFETLALLKEAVELEAQLNALALEEHELQKRYTEQHPVYQTLIGKRTQLTERLTSIRSQTSELPETQQDMLRLSQDLEVAQQIYLQLLNRAQELNVIKAGTIGNVRIIDTALASPQAVAPNKKMIVLLAGVLGLMAGMGLALLRAFLNRGVNSTDDIEKLGIPVYATIPRVGNGNFGDGNKHKAKRPILAKVDPTHLAVESLRSLRTSLHFGMMDSESSLLMITSAKPGDGKSFVSINLATVVAQTGQQVCLVDADIRRGYLRSFFGLGKHVKGLTDVLAGDALIEDVLVKDEETGLYLLPTGKYPPNPSELLMHPKFGEVAQYLDDRFDLVVLDTPPVLAVTDPAIVGKYVGMVLLVVQHKDTASSEISAAQKALDVSGVKISGSILNGYDVKAGQYGYGNYSYHYEYKSRDK